MADEAEGKISEATGELFKCVSEGFTGTLVIEFQKGVPMVRKKTDLKRFGRRGAHVNLDAGSQSK